MTPDANVGQQLEDDWAVISARDMALNGIM
jgi:hypothetical protein